MAYNYGGSQYLGQPNYRPAPAQSQNYPTWNSQPVPLVRPVTSFEEVKASPIEFDGSVFYFTDIANKKIYTKQIGMDGSAIINLYEQKEIKPIETNNQLSDYVTKDEFETTIKQLIEKLKANDSPEQAKKKPLFEI